MVRQLIFSREFRGFFEFTLVLGCGTGCLVRFQPLSLRGRNGLFFDLPRHCDSEKQETGINATTQVSDAK